MLMILAQVKRKIADDPRYDAVGSSSLRDGLFGTYLKARGASSTQETAEAVAPSAEANEGNGGPVEDESEKARKRKERKERAVKEREEKIRAERSKVDADIDRSRNVINKEEGELDFRCAAYLATARSCLAPLT